AAGTVPASGARSGSVGGPTSGPSATREAAVPISRAKARSMAAWGCRDRRCGRYPSAHGGVPAPAEEQPRSGAAPSRRPAGLPGGRPTTNPRRPCGLPGLRSPTGAAGFEPATSWLTARRSAGCSTPHHAAAGETYAPSNEAAATLPDRGRPALRCLGRLGESAIAIPVGIAIRIRIRMAGRAVHGGDYHHTTATRQPRGDEGKSRILRTPPNPYRTPGALPRSRPHPIEERTP